MFHKMRASIDWCFFTGKNYSFLVTAEEDSPNHQIAKGEKIKIRYFDKFQRQHQFSDIIRNRKVELDLAPNPSTTLVNGFTVKFFSCSDIKCVS